MGKAAWWGAACSHRWVCHPPRNASWSSEHRAHLHELWRSNPPDEVVLSSCPPLYFTVEEERRSGTTEGREGVALGSMRAVTILTSGVGQHPTILEPDGDLLTGLEQAVVCVEIHLSLSRFPPSDLPLSCSPFTITYK